MRIKNAHSPINVGVRSYQKSSKCCRSPSGLQDFLFLKAAAFGFRLFASSVSPYYVVLLQLADSDTQDGRMTAKD